MPDRDPRTRSLRVRPSHVQARATVPSSVGFHVCRWLRAPVGVFWDADQSPEARGRHLRLEADHLEPLVGPSPCARRSSSRRAARRTPPRAPPSAPRPPRVAAAHAFGPGLPFRRGLACRSRKSRFQFETTAPPPCRASSLSDRHLLGDDCEDKPICRQQREQDDVPNAAPFTRSPTLTYCQIS